MISPEYQQMFPQQIVDTVMGAVQRFAEREGIAKSKQVVVDGIMDSFVNSYAVGSMYSAMGTKVDIDPLVRRHLETLYDLLTNKK